MIVSTRKAAQYRERLVPPKRSIIMLSSEEKIWVLIRRKQHASTRPRPSQLESQLGASSDKGLEPLKLSVSSVK